MAKWYVKDLSQLTGVSVQTLHHYDRIGLLKPSVRRPNGYRLYSEDDLLRLEQIIALKFFGFELSQIKEFLAGNAGTLEHFTVQAKLLEQKANKLLEASTVLNSVIADVSDDKSIPWENIITLIKGYRMIQELEHSWVKEIFTPDELKQYATFESEMVSNASPQQMAAFQKNWSNLVSEINKNLDTDPSSATGIAIGKKCMDLINSVYGKKYAHLRTKKFKQGFLQGKGLDEISLTPKAVAWLDKATTAYWQDRIYKVLSKVGSGSSDETIYMLWSSLLDELCGEDDHHKKEVYDIAIADAKVSKAAKEWLKALRKLITSSRHLL
ncbi:MAG: MerR family transcriptional regulator [Epsilonproteobacteria bacterium]|nr:MerR family transcriptional regulator [Campylobacterota bacterium]